MSELEGRLRGPGLRLRTGPLVTCIRSPLREIARGIEVLYAQHPVESEESFADFHVLIARASGVRRWVRPQVLFHFDGRPPFHPLPADQAFPILEWGLNWCISAHCHQYLILHAAVVERAGRALLLPGPPGSGKSTLCAALAHRGWRLLSDELALLDPGTGALHALARPVSLKNASIELIRRFAPAAVFGETAHDTLKGSVAHMCPPEAAVHRVDEAAVARWIAMPRYAAGSPAQLTALRRGRAFMRLAEGAFNYHVHGRHGFELLADLVEACDCFEFCYAELEDAVALFEDLAQRT